MLIFLVFTAIFLIANIGMGKFMLIAISPEQMFDKIFGWQDMLNRLYGGGKFQQLAGKFLGNCETCFLHFISIINFVFYFVFMIVGLHKWVCEISNSWQFWVITIIWYFVYVIIGWTLSMKYNLEYEKEEKG